MSGKTQDKQNRLLRQAIRKAGERQREQKLRIRELEQQLEQTQNAAPNPGRITQDYARGQVTQLLLGRAMHLLNTRHDTDPVTFNLAANELEEQCSKVTEAFAKQEEEK
jgi:hypothetical protein